MYYSDQGQNLNLGRHEQAKPVLYVIQNHHLTHKTTNYPRSILARPLQWLAAIGKIDDRPLIFYQMCKLSTKIVKHLNNHIKARKSTIDPPKLSYIARL